AEGNSWYVWNTGGKTTTADYTEHNWDGTSETLRTYFRVETAGELHLGIVAKTSAGKSVLTATFVAKTFNVEVSKQSFSNIYIA
ncbi:MAG TPA: hypothetical protein DCQ31_17920, partial [Bacteroidales bacterium]|nr:hypothetical protein [Bacteroidales bacterium]